MLEGMCGRVRVALAACFFHPMKRKARAKTAGPRTAARTTCTSGPLLRKIWPLCNRRHVCGFAGLRLCNSWGLFTALDQTRLTTNHRSHIAYNPKAAPVVALLHRDQLPNVIREQRALGDVLQRKHAQAGAVAHLLDAQLVLGIMRL